MLRKVFFHQEPLANFTIPKLARVVGVLSGVGKSSQTHYLDQMLLVLAPSGWWFLAGNNNIGCVNGCNIEPFLINVDSIHHITEEFVIGVNK